MTEQLSLTAESSSILRWCFFVMQVSDFLRVAIWAFFHLHNYPWTWIKLFSKCACTTFLNNWSPGAWTSILLSFSLCQTNLHLLFGFIVKDILFALTSILSSEFFISVFILLTSRSPSFQSFLGTASYSYVMDVYSCYVSMELINKMFSFLPFLA